MAKDDVKNQAKAPPYSKDSEMMVLGCMLTDINSLNTASDALDDSDFYFSEHKHIFQVLKNCFKQDKPADVHIVAEELKNIDKLGSVGGVSYLISLAQYAGTSAHTEEYCRLVKDKSILRKMITAAQEVERKALNDASDVASALDDAQKLFFNISQQSSRDTGKTVRDILSGSKAESGTAFLKALEAKQEHYRIHGPEEAGIAGVRTHFTDLDKMLNGFQNSNLMILAARPAMGKTAFALNVAENLCFKNNLPVGIFSLEMSAEQLVHRMICSRAEVSSEKIKTGSLNGMEYQKVVGVVGEMQSHSMIIDDQPGLRITDLRARARRMKESHDIGFLMVDYLQLITGSGTLRSTESRQVEISEISRLLKNLARELNVPVLCLSQLSREVEKRPGHRPMMSDLRESGSIEQDADIVMFLLRQSYYDETVKPGVAELIVGKNRHGPVGVVNLTYRKEFALFANYSPLSAQGEVYDPESEAAFAEFAPA